ncbi:MAG: MGMT family protein [Ignisphaera sp.]|nr:MGMT family protein [Ignisphaera sp.]MCX8168394.1 MGMT family protein [Ignisphaera sp.]MDW8085774.1 MGMT family protein [Ignisphaera sp.]
MTFFVVEVHKGVTVVRRATKNDIAEIVYALIQLIPLGCVATYGDVAKVVGLSPRYIARILKENRNPIAVPCHRVIKSNGKVGGYTLDGKRASYFKERLLRLESLGKPLCRLKDELIRIQGFTDR